jgi:hypothetical protein
MTAGHQCISEHNPKSCLGRWSIQFSCHKYQRLSIPGDFLDAAK